MDKYKLLIFISLRDYLNRYYDFYVNRDFNKGLLAMTHYNMIQLSFEMLLDGLY